MKRGLLSIGFMALVCVAYPVLADDTCGPAGCDAGKAQAGQTTAPPVPSIIRSDWKKTILPPDAAKPPAVAAKPMQRPAQPQPAQAPGKTPAPAASSRTLDSGFSEQELLPDPMSMAQKVSPEITTQVRLSNSDINRVICPVDMKDVIYSEEKGLTVNLSGKNAFVKFLVAKKDGKEMYSMTPSELYFVCDGQIYTMIAMPARVPAQTVQLVQGKAGTAKKNMDLYGELPFEKKIIAVVKRVYTNDAPDSFTKTVVERKMDVFKDLEVILRSIYSIEGEGLRVKEFEVRMSPASALDAISFKESDFLRTEISLHPVAVSVESMTLKKGETSRVFVVERNEGGQP
jgi:conjugal transfer pilus assembly protein TraK